ncbi:MAG: methyltransferase domain-containing protein [Actinobacteria bacterium]|nr:methyltransferase domain-containing protein [Actinomycetota bacterium]
MAGALELLGVGPGEALDAGMGAGRLLAELAQRGWVVSGIDASAEMVAAARSRLPDSAARLVQGKIESLPFPDASFDAVVATGVLEYSELERALSELARVLRPGGLAVVSYPNPGAYYVVWQTRVWYRFVRAAKRVVRRPARTFPGGSPPVRPDRFHERFAAAGLRQERMEYTAFLVVPSPLDELFPRTTERLGRLLEGSRSRLRQHVAGQVVYRARKPGP